MLIRARVTRKGKHVYRYFERKHKGLEFSLLTFFKTTATPLLTPLKVLAPSADRVLILAMASPLRSISATIAAVIVADVPLSNSTSFSRWHSIARYFLEAMLSSWWLFKTTATLFLTPLIVLAPSADRVLILAMTSPLRCISASIAEVMVADVPWRPPRHR